MISSESVGDGPSSALAHQLIQDVSTPLHALEIVLIAIEQNFQIVRNLPWVSRLSISFCLFGALIYGGHRIGILPRIECTLTSSIAGCILPQFASEQRKDFPIGDDEIFVVLGYSHLKLAFAHLNFITYWSQKYPLKGNHCHQRQPKSPKMAISKSNNFILHLNRNDRVDLIEGWIKTGFNTGLLR